jgi:hypothetical protein
VAHPVATADPEPAQGGGQALHLFEQLGVGQHLTQF